jgi:hypothetical protein
MRLLKLSGLQNLVTEDRKKQSITLMYAKISKFSAIVQSFKYISKTAHRSHM